MFRKQFADVQDAFALAHAIVDTVREPLVVLDDELRVVAASRSFYLTFRVDRNETQGKLLFELGDGAGIFQSFACSWEKSYPSAAKWKTMRSITTFPILGPARCS